MLKNLKTVSDYDEVAAKAEDGDPSATAMINQSSFWAGRAAAVELERTPHHDSVDLQPKVKAPCQKCDDDKKHGLGRRSVRFNPFGRH